MNLFSIKIKRGWAFWFLLAGLFSARADAAPSMPPPNWSVDPAEFEFNMNAVIRVSFTGTPSNSAGNLVGAFVGNELRGVANPVFFGGDAYFFLSVYANQYKGETVHFKVYHAPTDAVYGVFEAVGFIHNLQVGTAEQPFWIDIDPNADFPPVLDLVLEDTTLQTIPFESVDLNSYLFSGDGDPVTWSAQPGPNLSVTLINGVLTVIPLTDTWIGTDSVRIIVTENTGNQLADTIVGWFTVLEDYGPPVWQAIPNQSIFSGEEFSDFDLDNYLNFNGPCREYDLTVYPFSGTAADPAWPLVAPGNPSMSIIARPLFADVQLAGAGAKLAAFVEGNLAGWSTATGVSPNVSYSLLLKNVGTGPITFQFFDAQNQYLYTESTGLTYVAGGSVGSIASPYLIQLSPLVPELNPNGEFSMIIDDPNWLGDFPVEFIVWDCDYPDLRRDTFPVLFSIVADIQPEITSAGTVNFEENACNALYDTQTNDPNDSEGMGLFYSLEGGADVTRFNIDPQMGILSWATGFSPDFENPQDANANNQYEVNIRVTNTASLFDVLALTVTITNQSTEPFNVGINNGANLICSNSTVELTATGGVSYIWNTGSTQPSITAINAGTYTVTATSTGNCTATTSVLVAPTPSISAVGNSGLVCIGSDIQLSSTPAGGSAPYGNFSWTGPNGFSANMEDPAGFPATANDGGVYTVTMVDNAGCSASASTTIIVSGNSAPSVSVSSNSPVCEDANTVLNATPAGGSGSGYTFLWSGPNNYTATGQSPNPFLSSMATAGVYGVTVMDGAGCKGTGSATIVVNPKPTVVAASNSPVSEGGTILLSSSTSGGAGFGYTYQWNGPNNFSSVDAQPTGFTAGFASQGDYFVVVTDANQCSNTSSTTVLVVGCPSITASVSTAVCEGGLITLQSTPIGGAMPYQSFSWSGPNSYAASVEDPAAFQATMSAVGTYTVTVTDLLGCTGTASVSVVVNPNPAITAQNNGPLCSGAIAILTSNPSGGTPNYSFVWAGPNFFGAFVEDPSGFTAPVSASGVYTVTVTDSKGCTASATTNLVVNPKPTLSASSNTPLCTGATLDLNATPGGGSGGYAYLWTGPASFSSTLEDPKRTNVENSFTGTYSVTVTDNGGCTATATTSLSVSNNTAPEVTALSNSPLCAGGQLVLSSTPNGGTLPYTGFSWSGPSSYSSNLEDPTPFAAFLSNSGVYTVTVTDSKNCKGTASVSVNIFAPTLSPSTNSPICPGTTLQLFAGGPTGNGVTYSWTGPDNFSSVQADPSIVNATPAASGTYFVTVNDNGCIGTSSVTASVVDVTPPSITCPGNVTLNADANCSSLLGAYSAVSVSDNCNTNPVVTQSPAASTLLSGHNDVETVTLTANDGNGNTANCTFTVTLKDVTLPSITCPVNMTLSADANCSSLLGSYQPVLVGDNCNPNPTVTQSPAASTVLNGHNDVETVTLTANDGNGNTESCTFTVTLKDLTKPSITCPANTTLAADANCSSLLGTYPAVSVSDNCGPNPSVTQSPAASTVLNGHNDAETVTLTADDGNGNTEFCTFTVTLKDVTKPSITCPANTTLAADVNCNSLLGTYPAVLVSDNCNPNPTVTQSPASTTVLSGHNDVETVTLTADDGNGNTEFCTFTVTLKDVTKPSITCPANTTIAADANCSSLLGNYSAVSVSDNCTANPAVTQSPAASTVLNGHNDVETVTLTANDGNGNTESCTFTVTLKDLTKPSITCPANTTIAADANCSGVLGAYAPVAVSDNCSPNPTVTQSPAASTLLNGHNDAETVTLTADDGNGNTESCTFTVTLKDVTKPSITCPANTTLAADVNCSSLLGTYSAVLVSDNCNPNPTVTQNPASTTVLSGHNDVETVTLTANDGNGNTESCTFTVTLKDVAPPIVVCKPFTAALNTAGTVTILPTDVYQSGSDNCGVVNLVSVLPNTFNCSNLGANLVTLSANDGNGNTSTCNTTVTIVDLIPPTMVCTNVAVALNAAGTATVTAAQINNGSTDNCTLASLNLSPSNFTCVNLGTNLVTLTGTDQSGNTATCQGTVTVVDNIPPTMLCKNATLNLNNVGQATLTVADINNGSFDNCAIVQFSLSQTQFTCANIGNNTVVLTGIDQSNNVGTCTATVTVQDLIAPIAKCKNATANLSNLGKVTVQPGAVNNGSSDNCGFTMSLSPASFTCANIGLNTVTLTVTDNGGNTATCTAKVTIKDVTPPTALCKNFTVFLNDLGKATLTVANVDNGSTDNCGITSKALLQSDYNCSDIGAPVNNFLTVTDASGNSATCIALITVKDVSAPIPVCTNTTVTLMGGSATVYPAILADSSYDNCSITSFLPVAKTYYSPGIFNLPITMKDWSGNTANCTAVITVLQNSPARSPKDIGMVDSETMAQDLRLNIYPNPSSGDVVLEFDLPAEQEFEVFLSDLSGKIIVQDKNIGAKGQNKLPLRLAAAPPGMYFLELRAAHMKSRSRLIVQK